MYDTAPTDYKSSSSWFLYFRLTKHLPAMQEKYKAAIEKVTDEKAANVVKNGYVASVLDVLTNTVYMGFTPNTAKILALEFGLTWQDFVGLNIKDLACASGGNPYKMEEQMKAGGLDILGGVIMGLQAQFTEAAKKPEVVSVENEKTAKPDSNPPGPAL